MRNKKKAFREVFGDFTAFDNKFSSYIGSFLLNAGVVPSMPKLDPQTITTQSLTPSQASSQLGIFQARVNNVEGARRLFGEALREDPSNAEAHQELGFLNSTEGNLPAARKEWEQASALSPNMYRSIFALVVTGKPLRDQTREERQTALEQLRKAAHANMHFAAVYTQIALLQWWDGNLESALTAAQEAERLEPWRMSYRLLTARLLLAKGQGCAAAEAARSTAQIAYGVDRMEAVALWNSIPEAQRNGESVRDDLPPGAKSLHGTITDVKCDTAAKDVRFTFLPDGTRTPVQVHTLIGLHAGYTDTLWPGGGRVIFCHQAQAVPALVAFKPGPGSETQPLMVDLQENLPPPQTVAQLKP